ncbi:MAG: DnaJ domain-containing protein [Candidatus Methylopumilus sp.]
MISRKKTLYEILEVSAQATHSEINAAYQRLTQRLQAGVPGLSREDADLKQKLINLAYDTLSINSSRTAYDAKLGMTREPVKAASPFQVEVAIASDRKSPLKIILTIIAGLVAMGMVIQIAFMLLAYRHTERMVDGSDTAMSAAAQAEEKVRLQEYYQEHGVRAGSKEEADLLDAEERRIAGEQRRKDYEKQEQDRKYRQFVEESRREGERVSADLRRAEERARYEEERKQQKLDEDKRRQEEAERLRIEREQNKWKLRPSTNHYSNY